MKWIRGLTTDLGGSSRASSLALSLGCFSYIASNVLSVICNTHSLIWDMAKPVLNFLEGGASAAVSRLMLQARFETDVCLF